MGSGVARTWTDSPKWDVDLASGGLIHFAMMLSQYEGLNKVFFQVFLKYLWYCEHGEGSMAANDVTHHFMAMLQLPIQPNQLL